MRNRKVRAYDRKIHTHSLLVQLTGTKCFQRAIVMHRASALVPPHFLVTVITCYENLGLMGNETM